MKKLLFIIPVLFFFSCINEKDSSLPVLSTADVTMITQTTAVSGGTITDDGGSEIIARGVCWSTNPMPESSENKTVDGHGKGAFSSSFSGMNANTRYFVRAYAVNAAGTGYGNQVEFVTAQVEPWMQKPYFGLPATGIPLMTGQQVTIYGDALVNLPVNSNLKVTYKADIGTQSGNNLVINPGAAAAGNHDIEISFFSNGILLTTEKIIVTVYDRAASGNKNVLLIGDSTMESTLQPQGISEILDIPITFLGTIGATFRREWYAGATWSGYLSGIFGKFYKNGVFNIPAYFADYDVEMPDIVYIRLGINDVFDFSKDGVGPMTDQNLEKIMNDAKRMVDAFLAYNPQIKILLGLPTISENSGMGWAHDYDENYISQDAFIGNIHRYWIALVGTFANGRYDSRVDCSYEAIFLDRDEGYPKTGGIHSNGVHPDDSGYRQLAAGMALSVNKLLKTE